MPVFKDPNPPQSAAAITEDVLSGAVPCGGPSSMRRAVPVGRGALIVADDEREAPLLLVRNGFTLHPDVVARPEMLDAGGVERDHRGPAQCEVESSSRLIDAS